MIIGGKRIRDQKSDRGEVEIALTIRMNNDQKERAKKLVAKRHV
jgi:hypothetical protein